MSADDVIQNYPWIPEFGFMHKWILYFYEIAFLFIYPLAACFIISYFLKRIPVYFVCSQDLEMVNKSKTLFLHALKSLLEVFKIEHSCI